MGTLFRKKAYAAEHIRSTSSEDTVQAMRRISRGARATHEIMERVRGSFRGEARW
jgi:hypothetical protein